MLIHHLKPRKEDRELFGVRRQITIVFVATKNRLWTMSSRRKACRPSTDKRPVEWIAQQIRVRHQHLAAEAKHRIPLYLNWSQLRVQSKLSIICKELCKINKKKTLTRGAGSRLAPMNTIMVQVRVSIQKCTNSSHQYNSKTNTWINSSIMVLKTWRRSLN